MGRITVITSGKGGVGKTTATANLGVALSKLNQKVALVDMDMGLRNLDVILGLENRIVYDLVDVAEGICPLSRALIRDHQHPGLTLLPASRARGQEAVNVRQMRELTEQLARIHDHVLVDCPAGIEVGFNNALAGAHGAVIVTVPEVSAVRDAQRVAGLLREQEINAKLLINRVRPAMVRRGDMMDVDEVVDILKLPILGIVPEDNRVVRHNNFGIPIADGKGKAAESYCRIARRLKGEAIPIVNPTQSHGLALFWSALGG